MGLSFAPGSIENNLDLDALAEYNKSLLPEHLGAVKEQFNENDHLGSYNQSAPQSIFKNPSNQNLNSIHQENSNQNLNMGIQGLTISSIDRGS